MRLAKQKKPIEKRETIFEMEKRLEKEAFFISKNGKCNNEI
jgi:hypothetical protein